MGWRVVTGSHLHVTLGDIKPSLDPASCVASGTYLGLSEPREKDKPNELMCRQGTGRPNGL